MPCLMLKRFPPFSLYLLVPHTCVAVKCYASRLSRSAGAASAFLYFSPRSRACHQLHISDGPRRCAVFPTRLPTRSFLQRSRTAGAISSILCFRDYLSVLTPGVPAPSLSFGVSMVPYPGCLFLCGDDSFVTLTASSSVYEAIASFFGTSLK